MKIVETSIFTRQVKRLYPNQKSNLDDAIEKICTNPFIGEEKKGDLVGLYVYKFRMTKQLTLLAYEFYRDEVILHLIMFGSHENFYRDLKKYRVTL
jgi:mRNA-degrading endonuclease RelE of RelBE toxin-antitoxin system